MWTVAFGSVAEIAAGSVEFMALTIANERKRNNTKIHVARQCVANSK
jgi:hypothetical protein